MNSLSEAKVVLTSPLLPDYCARMSRTESILTTPTVPETGLPNAAGASGGSAGSESAPSVLPVIFFDGVCGLCNTWIDFVIRRDKLNRFRFGALQGETARDWLQMTPDSPLDSVTLADATGIYRKSDAVWRILVELGGLWWLFGGMLRLIPQPLRNWGYDFVARHRYQWFGKKESCRLPTPAERARFLP